MTQAIRAGDAPQETRWTGGALFFGLAIMAGVSGALYGFVMGNSAGPSADMLAPRHGFLLEFYAMPLALLGGIGRWLGPARLRSAGMVFPGLDQACAIGLALSLALLSFSPALAASVQELAGGVAILLWSVCMFGIATGSVVTILEDRPAKFRDFSPFLWSQLFGAATMLFLAPLVAAYVTQALFAGGWAAQSWGVLLATFRFPITAAVLVLSFGVASHAIVGASSRRVSQAFAALLGVMAFFGPLIWAHAFLHSAPLSGLVELCTLGVPACLFVALALSTMWSARVDVTPTTLWGVASFGFGSLGWVVYAGLMPASVFHSSVMFGAMFAVFCGCYAWVREIEKVAVPCWFEWMHLALCIGGAIGVLSGSEVLVRWGSVLLEMALFCVAPLACAVFGLRVLGRDRSRA